MKILHKQNVRRHRERGMATVLFIALLAIMAVLVVSNARPVMQLRVTEKMIEQKQIERLNASQTNAAPAVATVESK